MTYKFDLAVRTQNVGLCLLFTNDIYTSVRLICAQLYVLVSSINAIKAVLIGMTANSLLTHHCIDTCFLHRLPSMLHFSMSA
jgi:hypothetical protein